VEGAFSHKFSVTPSGETTDRMRKSYGVQKWDEPPLSPCQDGGDRASRAAVDEKVCCLLPGGLLAGQRCRYCIYAVVQKWVFGPQGPHIAPINVKFGTGERTVYPSFRMVPFSVSLNDPKPKFKGHTIM